MGTRRQARERAVQFLFQHDHNPPEDLAGTLEHFWVPEHVEQDWAQHWERYFHQLR